jgi:replicative DNA helicase
MESKPMTTPYEVALLARELGLSPIPPRPNGSKAPLADESDGSDEHGWKSFQTRPASIGQIQDWYERRGLTGVGLATGYGDLEMFEFDDGETYERFKEAAVVIGLGLLVEALEGGYLETTPGGGVHWLYLCEEVLSNTKLAERPIPGKPHQRKVLIETRGSGGYVVIAPSHGKVHPSGKPYRLLRGGLQSLIRLSKQDRQSLWDLARTFDEMPATIGREQEERPGEEFERSHTWEDLLEPLGWVKAFVRGNVTYWRRPGKDEGISATTGHCKGLYVFSTSTAFEPRKSYTRFGAYARLHHGDDHRAAARHLAEEQRQQGTRRAAPQVLRTQMVPAPPVGAPFDPSAEDALVGSCLWDCRMIDEASPIVEPGDIFQARQSEIWGFMIDLMTRAGTVDAVTLGHALRQQGRLEAVGGKDFLHQLKSTVIHGGHAREYAVIVREKAILRRLVEAMQDGLKVAASERCVASDLLCDVEERIFAVSERHGMDALSSMDIAIDEAWARMGVRAHDELLGLTVGFPDMDRCLLGLQRGQLIILAARPSIGKTSLAVDIMRLVAGTGKVILFFSLETSRQSLTDKMIVSSSGVARDVYACPKKQTGAQTLAIARACETLHGLPIWIDDTPSRTTAQMSAIARRLKRQRGLDLIIVDYLQLINGQAKRNDNRAEEISKVSRMLKAMAKTINVPVLALCQLNRQVEGRADHKPKLWDLRESGSIEQDADIVLLLHRPEFYDSQERPGEADIDVAKNRDGATGIVRLTFEKEFARFSSVAIQRENGHVEDTPY